jgi:hypothetical protein
MLSDRLSAGFADTADLRERLRRKPRDRLLCTRMIGQSAQRASSYSGPSTPGTACAGVSAETACELLHKALARMRPDVIADAKDLRSTLYAA